MITNYYHKWENEKEPEQVEKLHFISYVYENGGIKVYSNKNSNKFICALYQCRRLDGSIEILPFKEDYESETLFAVERDIGWNFTKYEDTDFEIDTLPDSINCTREEVELFETKGKRLPRPGRISKNLQEVINKDKRKRFILERILKEESFKHFHYIARLRLIYLETPTLQTLQDFQEIKKEFPKLNDELNVLINSLNVTEEMVLGFRDS